MPELEDALQRGVMPRATDADGNTLLHAACARGALRAAKLVVRWAVYSTHPPDRNFLNLQSAEGFTALDLARAGGFRKMEEGSWRWAPSGAAGRAWDLSRTIRPAPGAPGRPGARTGVITMRTILTRPGAGPRPGCRPAAPLRQQRGARVPGGGGYPGHVVPTHATGRHVSSYEPYALSVERVGRDPGVLDRSLARAAGAPAAPSSSDTYLMGALGGGAGGRTRRR